MHVRFLLCIDERFPGGTSSSVMEELKILSEAFSPDEVAVLVVQSAALADGTPPNERLAALLGALPFAVFEPMAGTLRRRGAAAEAAASLEADLMVVHNPLASFGLAAIGEAKVRARAAIVVAHQPYRDANGIPYYALGDVIRRVGAVAEHVLFAPIGSLSRWNLMAGRLARARITPFDWPNVFAAAKDTPAPSRFRHSEPLRIGRHSRADWVKWPATRAEFEQIYQHGRERQASFLGWGPYCEEMFPEGVPANWRTHRFGAVDPAAFLSSIDLFVYYHHENWVEGFGRTVAEAIFSGAPCVLQPSLEETFSGLGFYPQPDAVSEFLDHCDRRRDRLAQWSGFARQIAAACFGPFRLRAIYAALRSCDFSAADPVPHLLAAGASIGDDQRRMRAQLAEAKTIQRDLGLLPEKTGRQGEKPSRPEVCQAGEEARDTVDIAIYADMRSARSDAWRAIELAECFLAEGRSVAVVHVEGGNKADFSAPNPLFREMSPEIRLLGLEEAGEPSFLKARTGCILVSPHLQIGEAGRPLFSRIVRASTPAVLCIVDRKPPPQWFGPADSALTLIFGARPRWAVLGLTGEIGKILPQAFDAPELRAFVAPRPWSTPRDVRRLHGEPANVRRGRIGLMDSSQWRSENGGSVENVPWGPVFLYAMPHGRLAPADISERADTFEFKSGEIGFSRFLDKVDIVTYYPGDKPSDLQIIPVLRAVQSGALAIVDGKLKPLLKDAALYAAPAELQATIERYAGDRSHLLQTAISKTRRLAVGTRSKAVVEAVEGYLSGKPAAPRAPVQTPPAKKTPRPAAKREILFLSSNGVGLGHLTRLMAIARRLESHTPIFMTMSQAFGIVREAGWPVKYLPFHEVSGCDVADWNRWLAHELGDLVRFRKGVDCLVFDGSNPYSGLLGAALPAHLQKIWIQRGMWKHGHLQPEHIRRGRHFDLIIEPSDIAEGRAEIDVRSESFDKVKVDPIWLLEDDELLSRERARAELGLKENETYCLVQLGSGTNRDIISLIDAIVRSLRAKRVKICIAEWLMGSEVPRIWPDVTYLRVFPLARYFNAFDFAVSAAGYNSFHECIGFQLPTIFIANEHQTMDDQAARARFAMDQDAAIWIAESDVGKIDSVLDVLMEPAVRAMMVGACRELKSRNGAAAAARIIEDLADVSRTH